MRWLAHLVRRGFNEDAIAILALVFEGDLSCMGMAQGTHSASDAQQFAEMVPPLVPAMLRVAAALLGQAEAEDATQDAIIHAWQGWESLRDKNALRPWLLRITVNVCRQWRRGAFGRNQRFTLPLPDEGGADFATLADDPGDSHHAQVFDLQQAIARLRPDLRTIVVLRYLGGMDATEIGQALGMPAATVRTRLRRALGTLRDQLGADDAPLTPTQEDHHA